MHPEFLEKIIFSEEEIQRRVRELGEEITAYYRGEYGSDLELAVVSVLRGAVIFLADLIRHIDIDIKLDFMAISSYQGPNTGSGGVRIIKDLSGSIYDRHVLIVEDIIDTGLTLSYILRNLESRGPHDLKVCSLLDRTGRRITPLTVDFRGFEVGDEYLVGYGLDHLQKWRNLPYICTLKGVGPEV